jgi:hypothetical protein
MTRKIPCKVIKSVTLSRDVMPVLYSFMPDDKFSTDDVVNVDVCIRHTKSLPDRPGFLNISRAIIYDSLVGQVLDCYI